MAGRGRRMFPHDVAEHLGIERRTVIWHNYGANRRRRDGTPRAGDMPPPAGEDWHSVPTSLGWDVRHRAPWWWEADIDAWRETAEAARAEAWARPHGDRGEFVSQAEAAS